MLAHPVELLPHVADTLIALAGHYKLIIITKGDLLDQERKVAQSGLGDLFDGVEIVSNKTAAVYTQIFTRHGHAVGRCMMVGNSLKSDVLPALDAGAWGVHVPHHLTWALEHADPPENAAKFCTIPGIDALPPLLRGRHDTQAIVG